MGLQNKSQSILLGQLAWVSVPTLVGDGQGTTWNQYPMCTVNHITTFQATAGLLVQRQQGLALQARRPWNPDSPPCKYSWGQLGEQTRQFGVKKQFKWP